MTTIKQIPKKYSFSFKYKGNIYKLQSDPKGWDETAIGFSRTSDFGNNAEFAVPLLFGLKNRQFLLDVYKQENVFAYVEMIVEKRNQNYELENFYAYELDFTTFKDDTKYISIAGKELGLFDKVNTQRDTVFDIPLPSTNRMWLNYEGMTVEASNSIQLHFGDAIKLSNYNYAIRGSRVSRTYTKEISFTDINGLPYESTTLRALEDCVISYDMDINLTARQRRYVIGNPDTIKTTIRLKVFKPNNTSYDIKQWTHTSKRGMVINILVGLWQEAVFGFNIKEVLQVPLEAGDVLRLVLTTSQDTTMRVTEAVNSVINITQDTGSTFNGSRLQVFTFTYLLTELVKRIDSNALFEYTESVTPYLNLLTCTDAIKNIDRGDKGGVIRSSLTDCLKALDAIECIGVDFTGNKMTIYKRADVYKTTSSNGIIKVNKINVSADMSHSYNEFTIGWMTEYTREREGVKTTPILERKTFMLSDAKTKNKLEIVSPYVGDPFDVESYMLKVRNNIESSDEHKILQLAGVHSYIVEKDVINEYGIATQSRQSGLTYVIGEFNYDPNLNTTNYMGFMFQGWVTLNTTPDDANSFYFYVGVRQKGSTTITYIPVKRLDTNIVVESINITGSIPQEVWFSCGDAESEPFLFYTITGFPKGTYEVVAMATWRMADVSWGFGIDGILVTKTTARYLLFRGHQVLFSDIKNNETLFNIPYTPKRLAKKHINYLAISNYGLDKNIEFVKTETDTNLISIIAGETTSTKSLTFMDSGYNYAEKKITFHNSIDDIPLYAVFVGYNGNPITELLYAIDVNKETNTITFNIAPPNPVSGLNAITAQIGWVTENADIVTNGISPMFLPAVIEVETEEDIRSLSHIQTNKYLPYTFFDEKRGISYEGWINNITFAIGKKQSQQWELQAKKL